MSAEPAFFVDGLECTTACDPDLRNPVELAADVKVSRLRQGVADQERDRRRRHRRRPSGASRRPATSIWATRRSPSHTRGCRIRGAAAGDDLRGDDRRRPDLGRRPDARLHLARRRRELAPHGLHQLRRRPRRLGDGRRRGAAVLRPQPRRRDAVGGAARAGRSDADDPRAARRRSAARRRPIRSSASSAVTADRIQSHGLDVAKALGAAQHRAGLGGGREGDAIANARRSSQSVRGLARPGDQPRASRSRTARRTRSSSSRASTTARRSPARTRVDRPARQQRSSGPAPPAPTASRPVPAFRSKRTAAPATTRASGSGSPSSSSPRRTATSPTSAATGTKASSRGTSGPRSTCSEAEPLLRGSVFSDRGVYRLGEEVHFKAILRQNAPDGVRLLRSGTPVFVTVRDGQYRVVDERTVDRQQLEQRRVDADAAGRGRARQLLGARDSRERQAEAEAGRPAARRRRARSRRVRAVSEGGERLVPGRGVSPAGLPRRRHARRRPARSPANR